MHMHEFLVRDTAHLPGDITRNLVWDYYTDDYGNHHAVLVESEELGSVAIYGPELTLLRNDDVRIRSGGATRAWDVGEMVAYAEVIAALRSYAAGQDAYRAFLGEEA